MAKKQKAPEINLGKNTFAKTILDIFTQFPQSGFNYKQVAKRLGIQDRASKDLVKDILHRLYLAQELTENKRGKYQLNPAKHPAKSARTYMTGTVDMKQTGKAYVIPEDNSEDIFIDVNNTNHALHGDTVKVYLFPVRKGHKQEGEIVEILKRKKKQFVGVLSVSKNYAFLVPDGSYMPVDIFIPASKLKGGKNGEKAVVTITEWPAQSANPFGEVTDVLGRPGDNEVEMESILAEFEFPLSFSPRAEKEAKFFPADIPAEEIAKRKDFRDVLTITIDPADAKDFDDAISLKELPGGRYEVGVHIADVSWYVKPGTVIDKEALERGTSVYLVDRTIPMLPERLSNELCSLREKEDRLCFSAVFETDPEGHIYKEWFGKTVIHSNKRFNYDEVQKIIETGQGEYANEIGIFNTIATALRDERFKKGAINFETQEVKFYLDSKGKPTGVYIREMKDSNKLIEDFMLLANRKVAEWIGKPGEKHKAKTFVYRVHDQPNSEKLEAFINFLQKLGHRMKAGTKRALAQSFNKLFTDIKGTGQENMIETIAIRTMSKAYYSTDNIGHYGLAFDFYSHFTSPIRRYPDLMVHRLLDEYLRNGPSANKEEYEEMCDHASEMEKKAADAERMSVKYKQVEYMQDKIGQVFDGLVSGVSKWGIYVEILESKCEGMVRLRDLGDDYYYLDEENYQVIGQRSGQQYKLGDKVKIRVKRIDLPRKQMDFDLVSSYS